MKRYFGGAVIAAFVCVMLGGCSKPPSDEIAKAEKSLQDARTALVDKYAPKKYKEYEKAFADAKALVEAKKYEEAKNALIELEKGISDLKVASDRIKDKMKLEAEEDVPKLDAEIAKAKAAVSAKKLEGEEKKTAENTLTKIDQLNSEIKKAMEAGEFWEVKPRVNQIHNKIAGLTGEGGKGTEAKAGGEQKQEQPKEGKGKGKGAPKKKGDKKT